MKKSVVTGGCGFIGSHLVDRLIAEGHQVLVLDNCSTGRLQNLSHLKNHPQLKVEVVDLTDVKVDLSAYFNDVDYIYHLAALADIVPSIENPVEYYNSNVFGTLRVLEAAKNKTQLKKLIYAASSSCYGIPDQYPTAETAEMRPQYPYALTKRLGEEIALHWGMLYKIPVLSLRFFNVYGPRSRTSGTYGAVFGVFLAQKLAQSAYTVVGDGNQTRDFTFVTDVVDAVFTASQSKIQNEIFNVGSGSHHSVNKIVQLLEGSKTHIPKRPGEPDCTFADISKIKNQLHWSAKVPIEKGIKILLENIDYWKEAPVWTPESIQVATKSWFDSLTANNK